MEERIRIAVQEALVEAGAGEASFAVERPAVASYGDYTTNAAMVVAKTLGQNPRELADSLARSIEKTLGEAVSKVEAVNPGFINITLSPESVRLMIAEADARGEEWGRGVAYEGQRVMVEYTQPNPFKEMHIGHLMSNAVGESVSRLVANEGATLARANYQGDVGPHVAKAIWGLQKAGITEPVSADELGRAYVDGNTAYEADPQAKAEIDALNVQIYKANDSALMELWRKGRDVSLAEFERLYKILGTKFDYYFFESETAEPGLRIVRDGVASGVFEESEGAVIYNGERKNLHTLVFITSRGTPTYEAKEIGLAFIKEERWPSDISVVTTSTEQIGHFKVVKAALEDVAPLLGAKTSHVAHGFLRLASGKMSSREGNVITAAMLIEDVIKKASEKSGDPLVAEQVAIGAIKYMILRQAPGSDIIFDAEKSLSLEGDSGPYLQYALVRAAKILTYSSEEAGGTDEPSEPYAIERLIIHYPAVAARAAELLSPNLLTTYLTELAAAWNSFYASEQVLGSAEEAYKMRVARAFANTMVNGLGLLGIPAPERM